jgi:hypothetical protein
MRLPTRTPRGRHFAGRAVPDERPARDELEAPGGPLLGIDIPIDIDAADAWEDGQPRARVTRGRVAFAVSITLAALPVLVLDNFPATAAPGGDDGPTISITDEDEADSDGALSVEADLSEPLHGTIDIDAPATLVTVAPPTVYVDTPVTTITLPPVTAPVAPPTTLARKASPVTTTTVKPTTTTAPVRTAISPDPDDIATWDALARCESGGNWAANTGNGYYGGIQFSLSSWQAAGGAGRPDQASRETQIAIGQRLWHQGGWVHWPACSAKLGYR